MVFNESWAYSPQNLIDVGFIVGSVDLMNHAIFADSLTRYQGHYLWKVRKFYWKMIRIIISMIKLSSLILFHLWWKRPTLNSLTPYVKHSILMMSLQPTFAATTSTDEHSQSGTVTWLGYLITSPVIISVPPFPCMTLSLDCKSLYFCNGNIKWPLLSFVHWRRVIFR